MSTPTGTKGGGVSKGHAVFLIIVATVALLMFTVATLIEIQTSAAFMLRHSTHSVKPDLSVIMQIPNLVQGKLGHSEMIADFFAWTFELIFLFCAFCYEHAHGAVRDANRHLTQLFVWGMFIVGAFQFWSDFQYAEGIASGFWGQLGFAFAVSFCVFFFGIIAAKLYEIGFSSIRH